MNWRTVAVLGAVLGMGALACAPAAARPAASPAGASSAGASAGAVAAVGATVAPAAGAAARAVAPSPIKLSASFSSRSGNSTGLYVALERGYFAEQGLDVDLTFASSITAGQAMA